MAATIAFDNAKRVASLEEQHNDLLCDSRPSGLVLCSAVCYNAHPRNRPHTAYHNVALSKGVKAKELGLSRGDSEEAYVQCLDPCDITGGGTVRLEISRIHD